MKQHGKWREPEKEPGKGKRNNDNDIDDWVSENGNTWITVTRSWQKTQEKSRKNCSSHTKITTEKGSNKSLELLKKNDNVK